MSEFVIQAEASEGQAEVLVPATCRFFEGHFPGEPVLPAVAHWALADEVLSREVLGEPAHVCGIESFRLRGVVLPGAQLEIRVSQDGASNRVRWRVRQGASRVAEGILLVSPGRRPGSQPRGLDISAPPQHDYLPHRGPALLIEEVFEGANERSTARGRIPLSSPFVRTETGRAWFPAYLVVELGAQAAAASEARQRRELEPGDEPTAGLLVRASNVRSTSPDLDAEDSWLVRAELLQAAPPLRTWSCSLIRDESVVAEAEVATFARG